MPGGLGPQSPFAGMLSDLPANLGSGWQAVDIATRALKIALRSVDFQKIPAVVAVIQSQISTLNSLVNSYTTGTASSPSTPSVTAPKENAAEGGPTDAADADAQPGALGADESP